VEKRDLVRGDLGRRMRRSQRGWGRKVARVKAVWMEGGEVVREEAVVERAVVRVVRSSKGRDEMAESLVCELVL